MNTIGSIEEGKMASVKGRFFIIGTQRSGTTLLRLILNSHSQIAIPRESVFLMPLLKKRFINRCFSGKTIKVLGVYFSSRPKLKLTYVESLFFFKRETTINKSLLVMA